MFKFVTLLLLSCQLATPATLRFRVSARQLILSEYNNGDKPDVYVKVFYPEGNQIGSTGVQNDNQYPRWDNIFTINYNAGGTDLLKIEVYDKDNWLNPDDWIGTVKIHPKDVGKGVDRELRGYSDVWAGLIRINVLP